MSEQVLVIIFLMYTGAVLYVGYTIGYQAAINHMKKVRNRR